MNFKDIPVTCHPAYTWLWNSTITKEEIRRQIEEMYNAGIRAFYVLGEPENFRPQIRRTHLSPEYLSEGYFDLVFYAYCVAEEKGMYTWLYNEGGFPSGSACGKIRAQNPELAMKEIRLKTVTLCKGTPYLPDRGTVAAFNRTKRVKYGAAFEEDTVITEYIPSSVQGSTADIRTDNASLKNTEIFLQITHEALKRKFGSHMGENITLMFDDEAYMGTWTENLDAIFQKTYGYDLCDYLPYIAGGFEPETDEQYRAKSDYIMLCGDLVRENYFIPMKEWLNKNHMLSIGHLDNDSQVEGTVKNRYGNALKTLRAFDVPGIDVIWSQITYPQNGKCCSEGNEFFPRMASSAARQSGHSRCVSESFAVYGSHVTPEEMRFVVNYQAVRGISLFNFMVISYDRKSAMCLQYRPNFIAENPGMDCLGQINDYTARLSYILQSGRAEISTALYYPARTICAGGRKGKAAEKSFLDLGHMLENKGVSFDVIDEDFVLAAEKHAGLLVGEHVTYQNIFIPDTSLERSEVLEKLKNTGKEIMPCIERQNPFIASRKIIFDDGSEMYFVCNTSGEGVSETIVIPSEKTPYLVDLYTGELMEPVYKSECGKISLTIDLSRGEGLAVYLTDAVQQSRPISKTEIYAVLEDFQSFVNRQYILDPDEGPKNLYYECVKSEKGLGLWDAGFSGEVTYTVRLPALPKGRLMLDLGTVHHFAKVYINGEKICEATMPPYVVKISGAKENDELKIVVANTTANVCRDAEFFERQDIRDVGPYHAKMKMAEANAPAGGLLGPVRILRATD